MDDIYFLLKKFISFFFTPLGALFLVIVIFLLLRRKAPVLSRAVLVGALLLFYLLAIPAVATLLTRPLELRHNYVAISELSGIKDIVVLGAGVRHGEYSVYDQIGGHGLNRVLYGASLYHALPGARLYLSGGGYGQDGNEATAMGRLAMVLGVPAKDIVIENQSWDTDDQARLLAPMLAGRPFALVTSAWHMPRALRLFSNQGLFPQPAPTDFCARNLKLTFESFLPSAYALNQSTMAIKEYLGWLWAAL